MTQTLTFNGPSKELADSLLHKDIRLLHPTSYFEEIQARRQTDQAKKDFFNDQDSNYGPGIINNIIRNILSVRHGTLGGDYNFGLRADNLLFEQLDWANLEFLRTAIMADLNTQLPQGVDVFEVELEVPKEPNGKISDTLNINIGYTLDSNFNSIETTPETIGNREYHFAINIHGFNGFDSISTLRGGDHG